MNDLRPIDGNGHVPDTDGSATLADRPESPDYERGYEQALLDVMYAQLTKMREDLAIAVALDRITRRRLR